uniref:Uncharacterized protein n=1 Tax=Craspedostauros australis TaxID=1486917 RepID=A0A7R9WQ26_9STRA
MRPIFYDRVKPALSRLQPALSAIAKPRNNVANDQEASHGENAQQEQQQERGMDMTVSQLEHILTQQQQQQQCVRTICRFEPCCTTDDVERQFDRLSGILQTSSNAEMLQLDQVIVPWNTSSQQQQPNSTTAERITDWTSTHLYPALPFGARFLEDHRSVGNFQGQCNAHGNPLDRHVVGVCHAFDDVCIATICAIVDLVPPVRLSVPRIAISLVDAMQWEAMIQNVDHVRLEDVNAACADWSSRDEHRYVHEEVWAWQRGMQLKESCISLDVA